MACLLWRGWASVWAALCLFLGGGGTEGRIERARRVGRDGSEGEREGGREGGSQAGRQARTERAGGEGPASWSWSSRLDIRSYY